VGSISKENIVEESKKHRWYDAIVAWANGEKIQVSPIGNESWTDVVDNTHQSPLFSDSKYMWRIKPKVVTKKYRMALVRDCAGKPDACAVEVTDSSIDTPAEYDIKGFIRWIGDIVEVEIESND
jgi:hypothetical protein